MLIHKYFSVLIYPYFNITDVINLRNLIVYYSFNSKYERQI